MTIKRSAKYPRLKSPIKRNPHCVSSRAAGIANSYIANSDSQKSPRSYGQPYIGFNYGFLHHTNNLAAQAILPHKKAAQQAAFTLSGGLDDLGVFVFSFVFSFFHRVFDLLEGFVFTFFELGKAFTH